jgi:hypothetical protein
MNYFLADAVGAPESALNALIISIILSPFIFAGLLIVFFRILDKFSKKKSHASNANT